MSYDQHAKAAAAVSARCAVVTLSDTRTEATDRSGKMVCDLLKAAGLLVVHYGVVMDDALPFERLLKSLIGREDVDVILSTGGTGVSRRDQASDVVERVIERRLEGFGELFRMLSWEEIGSGAMMSRAAGGVVGGEDGVCDAGVERGGGVGDEEADFAGVGAFD
jgi:molybdenum cofactor biosynthesis protein B